MIKTKYPSDLTQINRTVGTFHRNSKDKMTEPLASESIQVSTHMPF